MVSIFPHGGHIPSWWAYSLMVGIFPHGEHIPSWWAYLLGAEISGQIVPEATGIYALNRAVHFTIMEVGGPLLILVSDFKEPIPRLKQLGLSPPHVRSIHPDSPCS